MTDAKTPAELLADITEEARTLADNLLDAARAEDYERLRAVTCTAVDMLTNLGARLASLEVEGQTTAPTATPPAFKVGDRVRIARRFKPTEACWTWTPSMDATIGKCGTIGRVVDDVFHVQIDGDSVGWHYAPEALDILPPVKTAAEEWIDRVDPFAAGVYDED